MSKLAIAVILFVVLIKTAFGADLASIKEDAAINNNLNKALSASYMQQLALNPYTSVSNYTRAFKEELEITESLFNQKLGSAQEFMYAMFPDNDEEMAFFEMTCFVRNITGFVGYDNKTLMFKILGISKAVKAPVKKDLNWLHSVVTFEGNPTSFDENAAFSARPSQIVYINALAKLKKFNADLKTASVKRGESDYYKYGYKLLKIFE